MGALFFICGLPRVGSRIIDVDLTSHKFALFCPIETNNKEEVEKKFKSLGAQKIIVTKF